MSNEPRRQMYSTGVPNFRTERNPEQQRSNRNSRVLMPEGRHRIHPREHGVTRNPDSGKLAYAVDVQFKDGRHLTWFGALTTEDRGNGSAWDITKRALRSMGWTGDDIREVVLDKPAYATIAHEEFKGRVVEKIVSIDQSVVERNRLAPGAELDQLAAHLREVDGYRDPNPNDSAHGSDPGDPGDPGAPYGGDDDDDDDDDQGGD